MQSDLFSLKSYKSSAISHFNFSIIYRSIIFLLISSLAMSAKAQLINNGGTIIVETGARINCLGDFTNKTGTVSNNGILDVQGSFINAGAYNSIANDDSLLMSGDGNAVLSPGGSPFHYLLINKATNTDSVTLAGTAVVNNKLDYQTGLLMTDYTANPSYVIAAPFTAIFNFAAGREIIGNVKRTGWANGSPVAFNSTLLQITTKGGSSPTDVTVTMVPQAFGGDPSGDEKEVKRKFFVAQVGGSGFTADIQLPYVTSELNSNDEAKLIPWILVNGQWTARSTSVTRNIAENWVAATAMEAPFFGQEWKLADASAGPLPVRFTQFTAVCLTNGTNIAWSTSSESNNGYFEVEKSKNGDAWTSIGRVVPTAANSASAKSYQFMDEVGIAALYRIKQVDMDGSISYTSIIRTTCNGRSFFVNLYPVPAKDKLSLVISSEKPLKTTLSVVDNNGRVVMNLPLTVNKGTNNFTINISHLAQGLYHLKGGDKNFDIKQRFTINR